MHKGIVFLFVVFSTCGLARGIVHDPRQRVIQGAQVKLKAQNSKRTQSQPSSDGGEFEFSPVPIGNYTVTVSSPSFQQMEQDVIVQSDTRASIAENATDSGSRSIRSVS
jgi:Carboxypeptidase regulatory-like domain